MKQWLVRRGVLATLPLAAALALALDGCSSEPTEAGSSEAAKPSSPAETKQTEQEQEIAPSPAARDRLSRIGQFTRLIRVAKDHDAAGAAGRTSAKLVPGFQATAKLPSKHDLKEELRPVVAPAEEQRFFKRGDRIRAELKEIIRQDAVRPATVDLPVSSEGFVRVQAAASKFGVEFAAKGGKAGVPFETANGLVNYPGAAPGGGDMVLRVGRETVEDFVVLEAKPEHPYLDYRVKVGEIAGLRLYDEVLEFLSASGNPEVRVSPPEVVGANGKAHHAKLELLDCAFDSSAAVPWDRPVTAPGASECTLRVSWNEGEVLYPAIVDPVWSSGGTLAKGRYRNAAVKMSNGNVITCGGLDINGDALKTRLFQRIAR